ncbi:hypothetical protein, partial [Psychrobacter sp. TB55-MNA-CIBAN-0194]|uniref:hypothetical protein n=1 Tax=Psychrobacter sp. TB55-MNA-CIBAN-0194 TaxID=3140445 RepID=UPI0033317457
LLAKIVNDYPGILDARGALECFASKLAPTEDRREPPITPITEITHAADNRLIALSLHPLLSLRAA